MWLNMQIFDNKDLLKIHDFSVKTLEDPGMRILDDNMMQALSKKGARVDFEKKVVNFTPEIINETIDLMKKDLLDGRIPKYLNGVTSEKANGMKIQAKFGGACVQYLDWDKKSYRDPTEEDLINMVKLGEFIPEVATVGNPVVYLKDNVGNAIEPRMQRIKTAALVAKYTQKVGATEVWNAKELEYLIEMGVVVRGSSEDYFKNPCFITAKETIAPLILEEKSAEVLQALAARNLTCTIIPMPISGVSSPVSHMANVVIGNAEILGVAAALKAVCPSAKIIGGIISGTMDMATGTANFATPEATLQDLGLAEVHERLYGFNFGVGGYLDAKYPGIQNAIEKEFKYMALALSGRYTYPIGLVNWGKCFCPEQAMLDIQIIKNIHRFLEGIDIAVDDNEMLALIRKVGIGGSFLQEENTLKNYRRYLYMPELFDHTLSQGLEKDFERDSLLKAKEKIRRILLMDDLYKLDDDRCSEVDKIVARAEKYL